MIRAILAVAALSLAGHTASASTMVQYLPAIETQADQAPFDILGNDFNPSLGTLNSASATLSGTLSANVGPYQDGPASPFAGVIHYSLRGFGAGDFFSGTLGPITLFYANSFVKSAPTPFSVTVNFPDITNFTGTNTKDVLADFSVFATFSNNALSGSGLADDSTATAQLQLTYDYTVPEPASAALLALPVVALLLRRRMCNPGLST